MYDVYMNGKYQFTESQDLENFTVTPNPVSFDFTPRHGTIIPITAVEKQALLTKWSLTGMNSTNVSNSISLSPNPASDTLKVKIDNEIITDSELNVNDLTGKLILKKKLNSNNQILDISALRTGVYFMNISTDNMMVGSAKFIVR